MGSTATATATAAPARGTAGPSQSSDSLAHNLPGRLPRAGWMVLGLLATGLGFAGIAIPGLPATVFFIAAAGCFARSSPALLAWILELPKVGPLVRDYRAGHGMPGSAKMAATTIMVLAGSLSLAVLPERWLRVLVTALLALGAAVIWLAVPTSRPAVPGNPPVGRSR